MQVAKHLLISKQIFNKKNQKIKKQSLQLIAKNFLLSTGLIFEKKIELSKKQAFTKL